MRPRRGDTCSAHDTGAYCPERFAAVARREFIWQDYVGWLWLHPKVDQLTPWEFCPWCCESLPDAADEDALLDDPLDEYRQADGYDGEEGG